LEINMA